MSNNISNKTFELRQLANNHINFVLDKLGIQYSDRGLLLQGTCPCLHHIGDRNNVTAFSWKLDIGSWRCWTHLCNHIYGDDIYGLIRSVLDCSFQESVNILDQILKEEDLVFISLDNSKNHVVNKVLDEYRLKFLEPNPEYMIRRGFSEKVLKEYQVGLWRRLGTFMHDHIIFPLRNYCGRLVGFTGRTIYPENLWNTHGVKSKWIHGRYFDQFPKVGEFSTSNLLYNFHNIQDGTRSLFLVEGPLDGLRLQQAGFFNWCSPLGISLSNQQIMLLMKKSFSVIYILFDPDEAGQRAANKLKTRLNDVFEVNNLILSDDPGDLDTQQLKREMNIVGF